MEEAFSACKNEVQNLNNEGDASENVDRITNLPDNFIQCILSSLQTKDAVRTSLLSRRWRTQWMLVTKIDISGFGSNMSQKRLMKSHLSCLVNKECVKKLVLLN
ncbi:hypothetical protein S83_068317 [Arachis hypogaea]